MINNFNIFALIKVTTLQLAVQAFALAVGASAVEACAVTCGVALLAPLYLPAVRSLYQEAFGI